MDIFKLLNECRSNHETKPNMYYAYQDKKCLVSTDGYRLLLIPKQNDKTGYIDGNLRLLVNGGEFPNYKRAINIDDTWHYEELIIDIPKYFKAFSGRYPIYAAITKKGEFILNYNENTELLTRLDLRFLRLLADETLHFYTSGDNRCIIISPEQIKPSNESILKLDWCYFVMPCRN
jgi:hypothetical protein